MKITPVPAGLGPVPTKSSTSRPLSLVIAKIVPGASGAYPQDASGDLSRAPRGLAPFGPPSQGSSASRRDVYGEKGSSRRRETDEARSVGMTLVGSSTGTRSIFMIGENVRTKLQVPHGMEALKDTWSSIFLFFGSLFVCVLARCNGEI